MACTHTIKATCQSDNTVNVIFERSLQTLHMQMKFTHVMIV